MTDRPKLTIVPPGAPPSLDAFRAAEEERKTFARQVIEDTLVNNQEAVRRAAEIIATREIAVYASPAEFDILSRLARFVADYERMQWVRR